MTVRPRFFAALRMTGYSFRITNSALRMTVRPRFFAALRMTGYSFRITNSALRMTVRLFHCHPERSRQAE